MNPTKCAPFINSDRLPVSVCKCIAFISLYCDFGLFIAVLELAGDDLLCCEAASGKCQVMCFHPQSNVTLPLMSHSEIRLVIDEWARLSTELSTNYKWVQVLLSF